jgi:hypothetical protein
LGIPLYRRKGNEALKTLVDVWVVRSGAYTAYFTDKTKALLEMTNPATLEQFPENTVFTLQPGYMVVNYEPPKKSKKPKKPKLLTH